MQGQGQGQGITRRYYNWEYYVSIIQEAIKILTGSTAYQGIDVYFCDNVYVDILPSHSVRRVGIFS